MILTGPFRKEIRLALLEAYPNLNDLRMLVEDVLSEPLQNITMANDMPAVAFDLINWARSRGRLTELVAGAAGERPRSARLKAISGQFQFADAASGEEERIVRADVPFQNAGEWVDRFNRLRAAVCRIEPQPLAQSDAGYGTGFLVAPDVVLTNYHVACLPPFSDKALFRFDCETGSDGKETPGRVCKVAATWKLASSPKREDGGRDWALVRLAERVGDDSLPHGPRGSLRLRPATFKSGQPVFILQHPSGRPLRLAIGTVTAVSPTPDQVAYDANTEGGSSGSPCLNAALEVVALHHWGGQDHNRGIKAEAILRDLAALPDPELRQLGA
jgi:S1-C subfamily serine protease